MKHKPIKFLGVLGVITTATLIGAGEASAIVALDTFDNPSPNLSVTTGTDNNSAPESGSTMLGDERDTIATVTTNPLGGSLSVTTSGNGFSVIDLDTGVQGTVTYQYDGADGSPSLSTDGLTSIDITEGGDNDGLLFNIFSTDLNVAFDMTIYSNAGSNSSNLVETFDSSGEVFFNFAEFSGNADFTNVSAVQLGISSTNNQAFDTAFTSIAFTPDPNSTPIPFEAETSIALALLGSWGAWKRWKSRRTAANVN